MADGSLTTQIEDIIYDFLPTQRREYELSHYQASFSNKKPRRYKEINEHFLNRPVRIVSELCKTEFDSVFFFLSIVFVV